MDINGKKVKLEIWTIIGQQWFITIPTAYYRDTMVILLVYDITDKESFLNIKNYNNNIEQHVSHYVEKILIGNKYMNDNRIITKNIGQELADEYGIKFFETSVKYDINIKEAFMSIATDIVEKQITTSTSSCCIDFKKLMKKKKSKSTHKYVYLNKLIKL